MVNLGKQHLQGARRNETVAGWLSYTPFTEWAVIALFYAALQLVDSYLVGVKGVSSTTHEAMAANVERDPDLSVEVAQCLQTLRAASEAARYRQQSYTRSDYDHLREHYYQPLKAEIMKLNHKAKLLQRTELGGPHGGYLRLQRGQFAPLDRKVNRMNRRKQLPQDQDKAVRISTPRRTAIVCLLGAGQFEAGKGVCEYCRRCVTLHNDRSVQVQEKMSASLQGGNAGSRWGEPVGY